jgi:hypothetical protein
MLGITGHVRQLWLAFFLKRGHLVWYHDAQLGEHDPILLRKQVGHGLHLLDIYGMFGCWYCEPHDYVFLVSGT